MVDSHFSASRDHSFNTVKWHRAVCYNCMRLRLQKRYVFFLCSPKMDPINSVLSLLPSCFEVNFSGFRKITTILFFFFLDTPWVSKVRIHDLLAFKVDGKLNGTSSMEYKLLPIGRYERVAQHLWWNHFSSCVSLNGSKVQ